MIFIQKFINIIYIYKYYLHVIKKIFKSFIYIGVWDILEISVFHIRFYVKRIYYFLKQARNFCDLKKFV